MSADDIGAYLEDEARRLEPEWVSLGDDRRRACRLGVARAILFGMLEGDSTMLEIERARYREWQRQRSTTGAESEA